MRRTSILVVLLACAAVSARAQVQERVDVARVLVDVRVTTRGGGPITGLTRDAFRVEIDGRAARVESATWIGYRQEGVPATGDGDPRDVRPMMSSPARRLTVFMFQNSIDRSRVGGLIQMMRESARFVDRLGPADQAAVVVFDSRLRVWQDFTSDRRQLSEVLGKGVMFERPNDAVSDEVSLLSTIDRTAAERAATMETALLVIGRALEQIDGAKSLVIFGYGFGRFVPNIGSPMGMAELDRTYEQAREALIRARVTVFAMDVTDAEQHTQEMGLIAAAEETGGFYERVNKQQAYAMDRLEGALDGYYMLSVEKPATKPGRHTIKVRAEAPRAMVSARRYYVD